MTFELPKLPYALDALEPHISKETLEFHYGKHHQAYVNNLNKLVAGTTDQDKPLEDIIKSTCGDAIFNNAAQVWNHSFYWNCLTPNGSGEPSGKLLSAISEQFGSFKDFKEKFSEAATKFFGSGWAWLVQNTQGELEIICTSNAANPLTENKIPLLTCDVWEHAYYIDYRNARAKYIDAFWQTVNWSFVQSIS